MTKHRTLKVILGILLTLGVLHAIDPVSTADAVSVYRARINELIADAPSGRAQLTTVLAIPHLDASGTLDDDSGMTTTNVGIWTKYTVPYTDSAFEAASTTAAITLVQKPASGVIEGIVIKHSTAYAGTAVTAVDCTVGDTSDVDAFLSSFDVFQAVAATTFALDGGAYFTTTAAENTQIHCTANVNFGDGGTTALTAGSVDVWIKMATLP